MALWDLANSDVVVIMGSNMAENHPIAFRFVVEAQQRGAKVIHVDPRFTRTSALADIHAPIRSGSDIAFLGGIIHHLIEHDLWFKEFALAYTNIAHIIDEGYRDTEDNEGVFSGFDAATASYTDDTWQYEGKVVPTSIAEHAASTKNKDGSDTASMTKGPPAEDKTLQHPRCVFQILKRHFARYTPAFVESVTGCPRDTFLAIADELARNSGREKTGSFCYAVGWTHHSVGVQIIRACSIIQGMLGNIGRPGGGIMALRGHVSIQGSTDIPTLYNMLPTYLPQPNVFLKHATFEEYVATETPSTGWWSNFPKYATSLLKAWYGEAATKQNGYCYELLPKLVGDLLARADDHGDDGRHREGPVRPRAEPDRRGRQLRSRRARHGQARVAGRARLRADRDGELLEGRPPEREGRVGAGGHPDRGVLPAGRPARREGWHRHQHEPHGAVARQGVRGAGRQPLGPLVHLSSRLPAEGALRRQHGARDRACRPSPGIIR